MYYCPYRNIYYEGTGELQYYSGGRGVMDKTQIMQKWDSWRKYIAEGGTASWPRDEFESLVDELLEQIAFWEAKANEYKALLENMERVGK